MVDRRGRPRGSGTGAGGGGGSSRKRPVESSVGPSSAPAGTRRGEVDDSSSFSPRSLPSLSSTPSAPARPPTLPSQVPSIAGPSSDVPRPAKVPIPRLVSEADRASSSSTSRDAAEKHRVRHACEPCRSRKTKCSGERPTCAHCAEHGIECRYGDGKRDRAKRELGSLQERVEEYERLLQRLSLTADGATRLAIQKTLEKVAGPRTGNPSPSVQSPSVQGDTPGGASRGKGVDRDDDDDDDEDEDDDDKDGARAGEEDVTAAEARSTGSADRVQDDIGHAVAEAPTEGFFGPSSVTAWIRRLRNRLNAQPSTADPGRAQAEMSMPLVLAGHEGARGAHLLHQTGDLQLPPTLGPLDELWLPAKPVADLLLNAYLATIHPSFPILLSSAVVSAYEQCFDLYGRPPTKRWRALLNLIFAVGALYSSLARAGWCDDREHHSFFMRARLLALDESIFWVVDDLEQVQVTALAALYLVAAGHLERAWNMSGLAVRYAHSLGLHLRNVSDKITDVEKEHRIRLWWSIYTLDAILIGMTGRPGAIEQVDVATPLPAPIPESSFPPGGGPLYPRGPEHRDTGATARPASAPSLSGASAQQLSSSSSRTAYILRQIAPAPEGPLIPSGATFFLYRTRLAILEYRIFKTLYTAEAIQRSWAAQQSSIVELHALLSSWKSELPPVFDFERPHPDPSFMRERLILGLSYFSAVIIATRPCHCTQDDRVPDQSVQSKDRDEAMAATCVRAARSSLGLLPDAPNVAGLYSVGPWWCFLHLLTQAVGVLLVELSLPTSHLPHESDTTFALAKKGVHWLWAMSEHSTAASGAWATLDDILRRMAPMVGGDVSDMPTLTRATMGSFVGSYLPIFATPSYHGIGPVPPHDPSYHGEMSTQARFGSGLSQHPPMFPSPGQTQYYLQQAPTIGLLYPAPEEMDDPETNRPGGPNF